MKSSARWLGVAMLLCSASVLEAELTKAERKDAKAYLSGTLYTRIDIPCGTGRHPMGTYKFPLVEVSSEGVNTDDKNTFSAGWYHAQSTWWGIAPNDTLRLDEMDWDGETVEIELEGVGRTDGNDTIIKLIKIGTLDDFKKAADRAFARVPLQDEHADWPDDIKKAVADRRLVQGMTKRQVFYVTGNPEGTRETEENGKKVEVWTMRQNRGMEIGFWTFRSGETPSGLPQTLRFVDGKLADFEASTAGGVKLDD